MQPDNDAPLIEETPQDFADQPEEPFERKLHGEPAEAESGDDDRAGDEKERGKPA